MLAAFMKWHILLLERFIIEFGNFYENMKTSMSKIMKKISQLIKK